MNKGISRNEATILMALYGYPRMLKFGELDGMYGETGLTRSLANDFYNYLKDHDWFDEDGLSLQEYVDVFMENVEKEFSRECKYAKWYYVLNNYPKE